jgi:hypothetical protein
MTEDSITISAGAQVANIEPGTYLVTLIEIGEIRTILPQTGPNAGKEVNLRDWTFALEDGTEIRGSASVASGPKSKQFAWITALLGGTPPSIGQNIQFSQLVGREAHAAIAVDEGGWPKITGLTAIPKARLAAPAAVAAPPPTKATARVVAPVALGAADDLPF